MSTQRYYSFSIVTYHIDIDIIISFISKTFKHAYILHDKDENKDPHYHIICSFKANLSFERVKSYFPNNQNTFVQPLYDKLKSFRYLTHKDNSEKYQYSDDLVVCNDLRYYVQNSSSEKVLEREEFFNDIADNVLTEKELFLKYGRDYIKNRLSYINFVDKCLKQDNDIKRGYPSGIRLLTFSDFMFDCYSRLDQLNALHPDVQLDIFDLFPFIKN